MAQEIEKLLEKGSLPEEESSSESEKKEPTVQVRCPKCKEKVDAPLSKLFFATDTQISTVCPKCGLTVLDKKDSEKVIEAFKEHGVYEEKRRIKEKKKSEEEDIPDFELLKKLIDQSFDGLKISEQDKSEIIEWFSMYEGMIQDWFTPNIIQWVTAYIDFMLKQRSYAQKTVTKAVGRLNSKMQLEMAKRQREMAITNMFQQTGMFMQPQQQPGMPVVNPTLPNPPQMGFVPGVMQTAVPGMQPPGQQLGQPVPYGQQQSPQQTQQQTSPEVMQLMKEIQELKLQLAKQQEKSEEPEEVVEEILGEDGKPVKRIVRVKGAAKDRQKSPEEFLTSTMNLLKEMGVIKSPSELYAELKAAGVIPDMNVIKEMIEAAAKRSESPLDAFAQSDELREMREELEALREQLREEKTERMLAELQAKYNEKLMQYEAMLEELKKDISTKRFEGKPESVQELEVRKEVLSDISKDLKEIFKTVFEGVVEPMAEAQRMDRLMMLKRMEEAGQLPQGTFQKILGEQKKPKKEELEEVKQRLKKIRKSSKK